ncbi:YdaS family helix-turn-helix protein [Stenotrophomonas sp. PS02301]|uniref:transcriptional regulator n=1 Tax=Stenotrophomonas sp. PS02301 TaxID=2991427 RepID=UPI00249C970E|nr:YdaS family helix-turn-helix protein [Stenotrophomonas sp. PS02301]
MNIVESAISKLSPPSQAELARVCGQKPQAVTRWLAKGVVPAVHVLAIEAATGVSRHLLRPDVFGPPTNDGEVANAA